MGKSKDLSPRKIGQINVLLSQCTLKQMKLPRNLKFRLNQLVLLRERKIKARIWARIEMENVEEKRKHRQGLIE